MRASITTTLRAVGSLALVLAGPVMAQTYDVIDMHGHALPIDYYGPTPQRMCLPPKMPRASSRPTRRRC